MNLFDSKGHLHMERWLHLGNNYRAPLGGFGEDESGYNYDIIVSIDGFESRLEKKGELIKRKVFTRKESAIIWLTNLYKRFND